MGVARFCLYVGERVFLVFVLLSLPGGPFPPVSFAGLVVHKQCYSDHSHAKGESDDDEDGGGGDPFMWSCVGTENRTGDSGLKTKKPFHPKTPSLLLRHMFSSLGVSCFPLHL